MIYELNVCMIFLVVFKGMLFLLYIIFLVLYILYGFVDFFNGMGLFGGFFWYCISFEGLYCIFVIDIINNNVL